MIIDKITFWTSQMWKTFLLKPIENFFSSPIFNGQCRLSALLAYFTNSGSSSLLVCDPFTPELLRQQESVERSDAFNCSSVLVQFQSPGYRDESITHMGMG